MRCKAVLHTLFLSLAQCRVLHTCTLLVFAFFSRANIYLSNFFHLNRKYVYVAHRVTNVPIYFAVCVFLGACVDFWNMVIGFSLQSGSSLQIHQNWKVFLVDQDLWPPRRWRRLDSRRLDRAVNPPLLFHVIDVLRIWLRLFAWIIKIEQKN